MFFAFFDNFPIVTGDTGSYISSGFSLMPPIDRPIFYGLFIRFTSLGASVWLTVFVQCFILAYVVIQFLRKSIVGISNTHILAIVIFLSFFTICGWFASQLMPDIFVPIMILSCTIYLVFENTKVEKGIILSIILLSVLTHNSNYVIITIFSIAVLGLAIIINQLKSFVRKLFVLFSIGIISWVSLCTSNFIGGNGFVTSNATHVFVMGKLIESGVLKVYLEKACPTKNYKICKYKDNLPPVAWEFHWDATSPVQQEGGWMANKQEYNEIIFDILSRPKYYPFLLYKSFEATARQLSLTHIDGNYMLPWAIFDDGTAPFEAIEKYFPHELNEFKRSRQNEKTINISFFDNLFLLVILLTTIFSLFVSSYTNWELGKYAILIFIVFILLNAYSTAILSSVNARFNARVIWLLPFFNSIILYKTIQILSRTIKTKLK